MPQGCPLIVLNKILAVLYILVVYGRICFAEALTYFRWILGNDNLRLLVLMKIFDVQKERNELWLYKPPFAINRLGVVSVSTIVSLCEKVIAANNRQYTLTLPKNI